MFNFISIAIPVVVQLGFAANFPTDSLSSTSDDIQTSLPFYTVHDTTTFRNTEISTYVAMSTTPVPQITAHATINFTMINMHAHNNEQTTSMEMSSVTSTSGCSDLYSGCKDLIQVLDICKNSTQAKECRMTCNLCHLHQSVSPGIDQTTASKITTTNIPTMEQTTSMGIKTTRVTTKNTSSSECADTYVNCKYLIQSSTEICKNPSTADQCRSSCNICKKLSGDTSCKSIPEAEESFQDKGNGVCYYYINRHVRYPDAKDACEKHGTHLVHIETEIEELYIWAKMNELHVSQQVWLGMEKINGQYVWVDGSKHVPISEERWEGGGSPNQMYAYNTPPDHWQHAGTSNYNEILCEENYSNNLQGNVLAPVIG